MATWRVNLDIAWTVASGSPGTNTWVRRGRVENDQSSLDAASEELRVFYQAIRAWFPNTCTIRHEGVWSGATPDNVGETINTTPWTVTGNGGTGLAPPGLAVSIERRAASGGRKGKGRVYIGPLQAGIINGQGSLNGADAVVGQTAVNVLIADQANEGGRWAMVSRADGLVRDITSAQVQGKLAMLRSRRD